MRSASHPIRCALFVTRCFLFDFVVADPRVAQIDVAGVSLCFSNLNDVPDAVPCVFGEIFPETPAFELSLILGFTKEFVSS
jgi:hypothetical protein